VRLLNCQKKKGYNDKLSSKLKNIKNLINM
jgi:cystathionine beta-lyase family protein involved in aluminum resistance